jgi:hypothetical protein
MDAVPRESPTNGEGSKGREFSSFTLNGVFKNRGDTNMSEKDQHNLADCKNRRLKSVVVAKRNEFELTILISLTC